LTSLFFLFFFNQVRLAILGRLVKTHICALSVFSGRALLVSSMQVSGFLRQNCFCHFTALFAELSREYRTIHWYWISKEEVSC